MRRHPHRRSNSPRPRQQRDRTIFRARQHHRQRPRPEFFRQFFRHGIRDNMRERSHRTRIMADQRIKTWPPLGSIYFGDGLRIARIGPQPINRLGAKRDQLPAASRLAARARHGRSGGGFQSPAPPRPRPKRALLLPRQRIPSYKSSQAGSSLTINATFHARRHFLIAFSRAMASRISSYRSK